MKILMVNKFLYPNGGSETYIFKIGEELQKRGHEVEYFGMEHEGRIVDNRLHLFTKGMDFHAGKLQKLIYPFKILYSFEARKKMLQLMESMQPDVVHLNNINFQLTPSVIDAVTMYQKRTGKKVKIIYTAHDYQWVCPNHMMRRQDRQSESETVYINCEECTRNGFNSCSKYRCIHGSRLRSILGTMEAKLYQMRHTYEKVDCIICPSEFMQQKISSNPLLAPKTVMLRNFIEIDDKTSQDVEKERYITYFGRFSVEKGMKTLLSVVEKCPDINFRFAGTGPLEEEIGKYANVENLGFLTGEKLKSLIRKAECSIYPSEWYENGPFSVMESLMAGTPVIGARIGGIPELIQDGKNGLLFESGNAEDLEKAVRRIWDNPDENKKLIQGCKETRFDTVSDYCDRLQKIYTK